MNAMEKMTVEDHLKCFTQILLMGKRGFLQLGIGHQNQEELNLWWFLNILDAWISSQWITRGISHDIVCQLEFINFSKFLFLFLTNLSFALLKPGVNNVLTCFHLAPLRRVSTFLTGYSSKPLGWEIKNAQSAYFGECRARPFKFHWVCFLSYFVFVSVLQAPTDYGLTWDIAQLHELICWASAPSPLIYCIKEVYGKNALVPHE